MPIAPIAPVTTITPPPAASAAPAAEPSSSFGTTLSNAVDSLQQTQSVASSDEAQMAAGSGNLADTMIAASQASLETEVTDDLLTKAISSYDDIMNMSF